jgi:hypothetical protein
LVLFVKKSNVIFLVHKEEVELIYRNAIKGLIPLAREFFSYRNSRKFLKEYMSGFFKIVV